MDVGVPMSREQREELDRRLAILERDPSSGNSWDNVKSRLVLRKSVITLGLKRRTNNGVVSSRKNE